MRANYSRLNLRLAFTLMKRDYWDKKKEKMGLLRAFFTFFFLEFPALIVEHYCSKHFDVLIAGNDALAELILCIRLSKSGKQVLVHKCAPKSADYGVIMESSQRLITDSELVEIERLTGESLSNCDSYECLLRKLGEVVLRINSKDQRAFYTRHLHVVNSDFSDNVKSTYPNFCLAYQNENKNREKPFGLTPFSIREKQNKWFANYQCALSFNDVIILTKLNSSLSERYFQNAINFPALKAGIGDDWIYTAENRIHDLKALIAEVERRLQ